MFRRIATLWAVLWVGAAACGETGGCGGDATPPYPRTDPQAALTQRTTRLRLTQVGFDAVARGVPGLLRASCAPDSPPDPEAACDLDPANPDEIRIFISSPSEPLEFSVLGNDGEIRPGSLFAIDTATLEGNVHVRLVDVVGGQDGLQITLGCNADSLSACSDPAAYARGSLDMVFFIDETALWRGTPPLGWYDSACFAQDRSPSAPGLTIRSLRFTVYPRIELGADGRPYLLVEQEDVLVNRFDLALDVQLGEAAWDPTCQASNDNCNLCNSVDWIIDNLLEPVLESNTVASYLATVITRQIFGSFADRALDLEGWLGGEAFFGLTNPTAAPVGFRLAANIDSPDVTGNAGELGLNFDFDAGFVAAHHGCVGPLAAPSWVLPAAPDPGAMVTAADPVTGLMRPEAFDAALLVGDVLAERAMFELFDGGHTCLGLSAPVIEELSGGLFVPTVGSLSLIAPGLAGLAPADAPVDLALVPRFSPRVFFGTGEGVGNARDSHLQLVWPELGLELYPLVDDAVLRAVAFSFDLHLNISLLPTQNGDAELFIDDVRFENVVETYNEMNLRFDAGGFVELVGVFLPMILNGDPLQLQLTAETLGFPFVPKLRAVRALGAGERYLGLFVHFCIADDLADPNNPICYPAADSGNAAGFALGAELVGQAPGVVRLRARSDRASDLLELAVRVDGVGPWYGFSTSDADGVHTVRHPWLGLEGWHRLEVLGRDRRRPTEWAATELAVLVDRRPPVLRARRVAGGVTIEVGDDWTPAARVAVRALRRGATVEELDWSARRFVPAEADDELVLWARDDAGNASLPFTVAAVSQAAAVPATPSPRGCQAAGAPLVSLVLLGLAARRRARGR